MKNLLLIRHAKSSWNDPDLVDIDRPLNKRGKKEASLLGEILLERKILPQLVISSPAKRARSTASRLVKKLHYSRKNIEINELLYPGKLPELIEVIHSLNAKVNQVFIIGHDPALLELGNYLAGSSIEKLPTCGYILIKFHTTKWKDIGKKTGDVLMVDRVRRQ